MPAARLWRRIRESVEQAEEDARQGAERWITHSWAVCQTIHHALRYGDELPPTKQEHEDRKKAEKSGKDPPIDWNEVEEARKQMLESRKLLQYGLQGPQFFASYLGAEGVLDAPDESFEDFKKRLDEAEQPDYDEMDRQMRVGNERMLKKVRERQAQREHRSPEQIGE